MRRAILISILALALGLGFVSESEAVFYFGGGDGIRVAFRTNGHRVVWANVFARLNCVQENGERHFNRFKRNYAEPEHPLPVGRRGVFRWIDRPPIQEESYEVDEALIGHIGPNFVKGRYEYSFSISFRAAVRCQTNSYPFGPAEVPFRARRVR